MKVQLLVFVLSFLQVASGQAPTFAFNLRELRVSVAPTRTVNDIELVKTGTHENNITVMIQVLSVAPAAVEGTDFTVPERQFTFTSDTERVVVPFNVMDPDSIGEWGERFQLRIAGSSESVTVILLDDDVTIIGYDQPEYSVTEGGVSVQVCAGFRGVYTIPEGQFIEATVSIVPVLMGTESRITTTVIDNSGVPFTIGSTPRTLLIADFDALRVHCFNVTAVNNDVVDGSVFFNLSFASSGTTLQNVLPVQLENFMPTIVVFDNDRNTFTVMLEGGDSGSGAIVGREGSPPFNAPHVLRRGGFPTDLTYLVTLTTPDNTDFVFNPVSFPPTSETLQLPLHLIDDQVPEPRKSFNITIGNVEIGGGREGLQAQWSGFALVDVYDNDFAIGFSVSDLMISEGSSRTLDLSILDPTGDNVDPQASFPLTLQLRRVDDPSGTALVTLASTSVQLSSINPSASIQLMAGDDDLCSSEHRYRLSYNYTGSEAYTVLSNTRGEVDLQLMDDIDCATTTEPTEPPTTPETTTEFPTTPETTTEPPTTPETTTEPPTTPETTTEPPTTSETTTEPPTTPETTTEPPTTPETITEPPTTPETTTEPPTTVQPPTTSESTQPPATPEPTQASGLDGSAKVCIPCIVIPIVLILVLCCCFWWILIFICVFCKKRCRWYHNYDLQKKERAHENIYNIETMIPLSEKKLENGKTT